jgi:hypothetical protein
MEELLKQILEEMKHTNRRLENIENILGELAQAEENAEEEPEGFRTL